MDTDSEYNRNLHYLFGVLPYIIIYGGVSSVLNKFLNSTFYLTGFKKKCRLLHFLICERFKTPSVKNPVYAKKKCHS